MAVLIRRPLRRRPPQLSVTNILAWADAHYQRTGTWPSLSSGLIPPAFGDSWRRVDNALRYGLRGLPGRSSLARVLAEFRQVRNRGQLPLLRPRLILAWADAYHRRKGTWPTGDSEPIPEEPGETWRAVDNALRTAARSLPDRSSLAQFLLRHRGVRHPPTPAPADRPTTPCLGRCASPAHWTMASGETWENIGASLVIGRRGLRGGSSLAPLLAQHRRVRNLKQLSRMTLKQVREWAKASPAPHRAMANRGFRSRHRCFWRDLVGGEGPCQRLSRTPGRSNPRARVRSAKCSLPKGNANGIECGADPGLGGWALPAHGSLAPCPFRPNCRSAGGDVGRSRSGPAHHATGAGVSWNLSQIAHRASRPAYQLVSAEPDGAADPGVGTPPLLSPWHLAELLLRPNCRCSKRDVAGRRPSVARGVARPDQRKSLAQLLAERWEIRNRTNFPRLGQRQILTWANQFYRQNGSWPTAKSGVIRQAPEETWHGVNQALRVGCRGLRGGSSLARLFAHAFGARNRPNLPHEPPTNCAPGALNAREPHAVCRDLGHAQPTKPSRADAEQRARSKNHIVDFVDFVE
jgi:hypothetical protein